MPRFYVNSSDVNSSEDGSFITIRGQDATHINKVLRMHQGDSLTVCDENGYEYLTSIISLGDSVIVKVAEVNESHNEPPYKAVVYQALVKGDRFETVLQKGTELGAAEFVPVMSSRCIAKLDSKDCTKKIERWNKIVYEASKQCGRGTVPVVHLPLRFDEAINNASTADLPLFCYEAEGTLPLSNILKGNELPQSVSVFIGPEGGFSNEEASFASSKGMILTGLGNRILRTETAAPFVLSCLSLIYEI